MCRTARILLPGGSVVLVDDSDIDMLSHWSWYLTPSGYVTATHRGSRVRVRMNRLLVLPDRTQEVDHINGDLLDNRRRNLRVCTHRQNIQNTHVVRGLSRFKGVHQRSSGRWRAMITVEGRRVHLGNFSREAAAAAAYDRAAIEYFGTFAWTNFPHSKRRTS